MNLSFTLAMARREGRASWRRIGLYMFSISIGVAALVAINGFRGDVANAIRDQSRNLLGADLELRSRRPFPDSVRAVLDSMTARGTPVAYVTSFGSMALARRSGLTRLVNVRGVTGGYPYYGTIDTDPPGLWTTLQDDRRALVDPAVLVQLDARLGDTLSIGEVRFVIIGTLARVPGEVSLRSALGPRVYIPGRYLDDTGLLTFGSRAFYTAYLRFADAGGVERFLNRHNALFESQRVGYDTVSEREEELTESLDMLARYLGLVGLVALILGGIGVASAVNVFVKDKLETVAVLRCVGATQRTVFGVYVLQAALMGLVGAAAGALVGVAVQRTLPVLLADFLPLEVQPSLDGGAIVAGLGIGVWVAVLFALLPLLAVRDVTPLRALRREEEGDRPRRDLVRFAAYLALGATVLLLSLWQAPATGAGIAFAVAIGATTVVLGGLAWALTRATRRYFPRRAPYVVRQGIANLFRPHNQTVAVTLAVGFGVFLLGTLAVVQQNLLDAITVDTGPGRANLVVFDIQEDQRAGVEDLVHERGVEAPAMTPIVPARIARLNGRTTDEIAADSAGVRPARWALRREYRNTYRDTLVRTERLVAGAWWDEPGRGGRRSSSGLPRVSVEEGLLQELRLGIGDRITWDVQGVEVETEVASVREVNWARFEPNFFVVFEPGVLEQAPKSFVTLTRVGDPTTRAELQRDMVLRYPNISAIDLTLLQQTLDTLLGSVALAIRFMALFSIASGGIVLFGAIATSRFQRLRESVLLKTLGARARQVIKILVTEYLALGTLAGLTGALLAGAAGWALTTFFFRLDFRLAPLPLLVLTLAVVAAATVIGVLNSREVFRRAPLAVMREMGE